MRAGLVTISFRPLSPENIVTLAAGAGLECLEWGGDVHVPSGDAVAAERVGRLTRDAGLAVAAYGSYYRLGESEAKGLAFEAVLESAVALGAPVIRVWAGEKGSADVDAAGRAAVEADAWRIAEVSQRAGVIIGYEFHGGTLTDTIESTTALLDATEHPAIRSLWQPPVKMPPDECLSGLARVMPRLAHVHAFHWVEGFQDRRPLAEGADRWKRYLGAIRTAGKDPDVLLEFLPNDDPSLLGREAATLRAWLAA